MPAPEAASLDLSVEDVDDIHIAMMQRLGKVPQALTNPAALASALVRPRTAAHYEGADIWRQAAYLVHGIAKIHAFTDGNKRTATMALVIWLGLRGYSFGDRHQRFGRRLLLATRQPGNEGIADLADWLRHWAGNR